jgi:folate-binding protein YgfZ
MALLPDRGVVRVAGEDAGKLLQGTITGDVAALDSRSASYAALLSPQGKVLFDFFVVKAAGGFLLESGTDQVGALMKRLAMYKLRARVEIADATPDYRVIALWGDEPAAVHGPAAGTIGPFHDPRLAGLGQRVLADAAFAADVAASASARTESPEAYHAHRIALGVPEGGKDYALGETFPHEANLDVLGGVSFAKGCFIGQEVVSRVQHRGTARKRIVIVEGERPMRTGSAVMAGTAEIGIVGSAAGSRALALLRLDRAQEAIDGGQALSADGGRIAMRVPGYLKSAQAVAP